MVDFSGLQWEPSAPEHWRLEDGKLFVQPEPQRDYWSKTFYKPRLEQQNQRLKAI